MTTLTMPVKRDANLPNLDQTEFAIMGRPMGSVVTRVMLERNRLTMGPSAFWIRVVETEFPEFLESDPWDSPMRSLPLSSASVRLAAHYGSIAAALTPTRLPSN